MVAIAAGKTVGAAVVPASSCFSSLLDRKLLELWDEIAEDVEELDNCRRSVRLGLLGHSADLNGQGAVGCVKLPLDVHSDFSGVTDNAHKEGLDVLAIIYILQGVAGSLQLSNADCCWLLETVFQQLTDDVDVSSSEAVLLSGR